MKKNNSKRHIPKVGHSFLFWLVLPGMLVWLVIGYITGIAFDNPVWLGEGNAVDVDNKVVPYYRQYGNLSLDLNQPFITYWFDDAWLSQYSTAYPIMRRAGIVGVVGVTVNAIETQNYMNWGQLQTLQDEGWEMSNHSLSHDCAMDEWSREDVRFEYINSRLILWKNGLGSDIFVSPCGVDSQIMREEARKLFLSYRTVDPGFNDPNDIDFYGLKVQNIDNSTTSEDVFSWIDRALENNEWLILVFHKVGEQTDQPEGDAYNFSLENFEKVVDYTIASNINVVTPSQIIFSQEEYE